MKYFIFKNSTYSEDELRYSLGNTVQKYDKGIDLPKECYYSSLKGSYCVLNIRDKKYRGILTYRDFEYLNERIRVFVALRIMTHQDTQYSKFSSIGTSESDRDTISGKNCLDWEVYYAKVKDSMIPKQLGENHKCDLTANERCFISNPIQVNHKIFEFAVYETKEWVDQVRNEDFIYFDDAATIINAYIYKTIGSEDNEYFEIPFKNYQGKKIIGYHEGCKKYVLHAIVDEDVSLSWNESEQEIRRGYPAERLEDTDYWRKMEQDKDSNFVLSEEEMEIAKSSATFPLFISGRAGSGKSTLLQYLFAEIVVRALKNGMNDSALLPPVYLSYSSNLIDNAKSLSKSLFERNHTYLNILKESELSYVADIAPNMDKMFRVFQDVVKDCIRKNNPGILQDRFAQAKYISFSRFCREWNIQFSHTPNAKKEYGPNICWHVIRTYIKGWNSKSFMTPEEYSRIGNNHKTVTVETYKVIYEKVWVAWYSKLSDKWDDQDLVRYSLCPDNQIEPYVSEQFSAVFCDEAQDFTRIEIDFILKLSSFSNRSIQYVDEIKQLPFVFAGDEFQTLNPTGFSWDSLRSYFVDTLFEMVGLGESKDQSGIAKPVMLTYNYRSAPEVVKLGNRVQLLRACRLDEDSDPQKCYFMRQDNSVYCIPPDNANVWEKLSEMQVCLIVPSADGQGLEEFFNHTPVKKYIEFKDGTPQNITILNPLQAKGLEFQNVALYGFDRVLSDADLSMDKLNDWLENSSQQNLSIESSIDLKYLMSNVYVSITRAKNKLFILDDFEESTFWAFAFSHPEPELNAKVDHLQELMLNKVKNVSWKKEDLGYIRRGDVGNITSENLSDFGESVSDLEKKAEKIGDSRLMRQVAAIYNSHHDSDGYNRCQAKAARLDGDYQSAAELFSNSKEYNDAVWCYWQLLVSRKNIDRNIENIAKLTGKVSGIEVQDIVKICNYCINPDVKYSDVKSSLSMISSSCSNETEDAFDTKPWTDILHKLFDKLDLSEVCQNDMEYFLKLKNNLAKYMVSIPIDKLADMAFKTKDYSQAVALWDELGIKELPINYFRAKVEITEYPQKVIFLEKVGGDKWKDNVLSEYIKNNKKLYHDSVSDKIICLCICEKSKDEEFRLALPQMLASEINEQDWNFVVESAKKHKISINEDAIRAIGSVKFGHVDTWIPPTVTYQDPQAKVLFDVVQKISEVRSPAYEKILKDQKNNLKAYWNNAYAAFDDYLELLFFELGRRMEERTQHIDSCKFYEWAESKVQGDKNRVLKREMSMRWVVCKERQADSPAYVSKRNQLLDESLDKRHEIGIDENFPISECPEMTNESWEKIFNMVVNIGSSTVKDVGLGEDTGNGAVGNNGLDCQEKDKEDIHSPASVGNQSIVVQGYKLTWMPQKRDLAIEPDPNEDKLILKIKKGVLKDNDDFSFVEDRLIHDEKGIPTPFRIFTEKGFVIVQLMDGDRFTNCKFVFRVEDE